MRLIPLSHGMSAIVDDDDFERLSQFKWSRLIDRSIGGFYASRKVGANRTTSLMHREILNAPKGVIVDHINRNTLDNRKCNLRLVTPQQSTWNRGKNRNNSSGFTGVVFRKNLRSRPWEAHLRVDGKQVCLGAFRTAEEASAAFRAARNRIRGNFVPTEERTPCQP